jgi:transposase InsO family protein
VVEDAWPLRRAASGSRSRTRRQPGGRSRDFADALGPAVKHKRTRPYRPQTNGKVETFHRTLADE